MFQAFTHLKEVQIIREYAVLIMIDKISMMNWKNLNMLGPILRSLMNKDEYMGDRCIVLMGNLSRQCPVSSSSQTRNKSTGSV